MTSAPVDRTSWTEPGVFEEAPGVYRIPLPLPQDGLRAVNAYALVDPAAGITLIDPGWALPESEQSLHRALRVLGHDWGDICRFLVTHAHRDHYTQAAVLGERFAIALAAGIGERPIVELLVRGREERERRRVADLTRCGARALTEALQRAWRDDDFRVADWRGADQWLADGERLEVGFRTLDVIATPGHTSGHVVFRDAARQLLFAGDHVLPHITPSIGFEPIPAHSPLGDYLQSLRLLLELPDTVLLPAHGPAAASTHERVRELLQHHEQRLAHSLRAIHDGARTAMQAAQRLGWTRRERDFEELGVFDQMLATIETDAHLKVLVTLGQARVCQTDGVDSYEPAP